MCRLLSAPTSTCGNQRMIESLALTLLALFPSQDLSLNLELAIWVRLSGQ